MAAKNKAGGANDLRIQPLMQVASFAKDNAAGATIAVVADVGTSRRMRMEVLYTLGSAGFEHFCTAVQADGVLGCHRNLGTEARWRRSTTTFTLDPSASVHDVAPLVPAN